MGRRAPWIRRAAVLLVLGLAALALAVRTMAPSPSPPPSGSRTPSLAPEPGTTQAASAGGCGATLPITRDGATIRLPYCANGDLSAADPKIARLVVVIHGDGRNAADYYSYLVDALAAAGAHDTLVVAPEFLTSDDLKDRDLGDDTLYWSSDGWKEGDPSSSSSSHPRPWDISSFAALDRLVEAVSDRTRFPGLREVVVAGHSAGGQFVNRYAAGSPVEDQVGPLGIAFRYVIGNASSYLYFTKDRYRPDAQDFGPVDESHRRQCDSYDTYKYGLDGRNDYMAAASAAELGDRYRRRHVVYALGELDTNEHDSSMDHSCPGRLEGVNRRTRGLLYYRYLGFLFGSSVYQTHTLVTVPGVGHDGQAIFKSAALRPYLFGTSG